VLTVDIYAMKLRLGRPDIHFRIFIGLVLVLVLAVPISAGASGSRGASKTGKYRGQCRQLTKQINHFEGSILPLAIARGNRAWERATNAQVARLWHRRANLCPAYGAERTFIARARDKIRQFNKMVDVATRATVAFFTGGLSGGIGP
jgi:hypothetical protein